MSAFSQGAVIQTTSTITSGTLTLSPTSSPLIIKTGSASATITLPAADVPLRVSRAFTVFNQGTGIVNVNYKDNSLAAVVVPLGIKTFNLVSNSTLAGEWKIESSVFPETPLAVRQSDPNPDQNLVILGSAQYAPDGKGISASVFSSLTSPFPKTTIDLQTGSISGGAVTVEGAAFSLPATTATFYRRLALIYKPSSNSVDVKFSNEFGSFSSLPAPSTLFSSMPGIPIGMVDLQALASGGFKTADSATNVIENIVGSSSRIYNFQDMSEIIAASSRVFTDVTLPTTANVPGDILSEVLSDFDSEINQPLRISASAVPDAFLRFEKSVINSSDGGARTAPVFNDFLGNYPATTINFTTGAVSGGTITKDGAAFSLPSTTVGYFRRVAFVYKPDTEVIDCTFSDEADLFTSLTNAGILFSTLDGLPVGYVDIQAYAPASFKSAFSGTNVISNSVAGSPTVFRFGSGAGGSGSGDRSFNIANISTPNCSLKGGAILLTDGRKLASYSGSGTSSASFFKDISINLTTRFGGPPANSTTYYLYIDLGTLGPTITLTDTGEPIYGVTQNNIVVTTADPTLQDETRYISIGSLKTAIFGNVWSGTGATKTSQAKFRPNTQPSTVNPTVYRLSQQLIGSVGSVEQYAAGHVLGATSFPPALSSSAYSYYNLSSSLNDGSGNGRNLTASGSITFTGTSIFGISNSAAVLSGSALAESSSSFFSISSSFTAGGWFFHSTWTTTAGSPRVLLSKSDTAVTSGGFEIVLENVSSQSYLSFKFGANLAHTISIPTTNFEASSWHHCSIMFDASTLELRGYIDGSLVGTSAVVTFANPAVNFMVGARKASGVGSAFFTGRAEEIFFINSSISELSIRKLYSYKLVHSRSVAVKNQEWFGTFTDAVSTQENVAWIVDKYDPDTIFIDLSGFSPNTYAEIALRDNGYSGIVVSPTLFDTGYFTAAPASPQTHYLPGVPNSIVFLYEVTPGEFESKQVQGLISANSIQIGWDLSAYAFGPTQRGRIIASAGQSTASVPKATTGQSGIIKLDYTGFNKIIGTNEQYTTITNANLQPGDSALILNSYSVSGVENISVNDVSVTFMPGALISSTSSTNALSITGSRVNVYNANYAYTSTGTTIGISVSGNDNFINNLKFAVLSGTVSSAISVQSGALRNYLTASIRSSGGTITTTITDAGTDTDYSIRG
jgi:hypothetical protein